MCDILVVINFIGSWGYGWIKFCSSNFEFSAYFPFSCQQLVVTVLFFLATLIAESSYFYIKTV